MTERVPLPSEDTGDLNDEPASGETDEYLVAREEVPTTRPRSVCRARPSRVTTG